MYSGNKFHLEYTHPPNHDDDNVLILLLSIILLSVLCSQHFDPSLLESSLMRIRDANDCSDQHLDIFTADLRIVFMYLLYYVEVITE